MRILKTQPQSWQTSQRSVTTFWLPQFGQYMTLSQLGQQQLAAVPQFKLEHVASTDASVVADKTGNTDAPLTVNGHAGAKINFTHCSPLFTTKWQNTKIKV